MGVSRRVEIARALIAAGRAAEQPAAFLERGSTARSRVVIATLGAVARGETRIAAPAVFVVGDVVRQHEALTAVAERFTFAVA
jgi:uroporphyrin-III C-methyltransferase